MNKDRYVLRDSALSYGEFCDGYYEGTSYIYQGSRYANVNSSILKAKVYSSEARAEKAATMGFENYRFVVERISNE